jgi:hypothetical protein
MVEMVWPNGTTTRPIVTSGYGPRPVTIAGASSFHRGLDTIGYDLVCAVADGVVESVGWRPGWGGGGYMVWIRHDGFLSRLLHNAEGSARVSPGDAVRMGQPVAVMGNTGIDGGRHSHLEIVVNGTQVDPLPFVTARLAQHAITAARTVPEEEQDMQYIANFGGDILLVDVGQKTYWNIAAGMDTVANAFKRRDWFVKDLGMRELTGPQPPLFIAGFRNITDEATIDSKVLAELRAELSAHG